ncbi:MAG: hypothetical protein AAFZ91_15330 [Pseudomonadota bacterium]
MIRRILAASALVAIVGCETVPVEMPPDAFEALMQDTRTSTSVSVTENQLSAALTREDLSAAQRADLLLLRAEKRAENSFNLPAAVADLDTFLIENPEDPRQLDVTTSRDEVQSSIDEATRRLSRLQNLPDWFDDKVLMGALEEAALRYQRSGLTPTLPQTNILREFDYICGNGQSGSGEAVHTYGVIPDHADALVWCDPLPDS